MPRPRQITTEQILDPAVYAAERQERRVEMIALKRHRRVAIGPSATAHFENHATMLYQVQEMLHTERGGAEQLTDELAAYNPMVPNGREWTATIMFEVPDPVQRDRFLRTIGGVEDHFFLEIDGQRVAGVPEGDVERTNTEGKASSVHFLHFAIPDPLRAKIAAEADVRVAIGIDHPNYHHMTVLSAATRATLLQDLD